MISLLIVDQKDFTTKLFGQDMFDGFEIKEAVFITTFRTEISSDVPEQNSPVTWETVRPVAYRVLQGSNLPKKFHVVLKLSAANTLQKTKHCLRSL